MKASTAQQGKSSITTYQMKDPTGALAAWEWLRSPEATRCQLAPFCSAEKEKTVVSNYNYVLVFAGPRPTAAQVDAAFKAIPDKRDSSLPSILTFLPRQGLVPNSARYALGPVSFASFAPELSGAKPGFEDSAEAQIARYKLGDDAEAARFAVFNYPTPEMARLHAADFKRLSGVQVKRSGVLVALVFGPATQKQADTLLSRVQYEAKITWNDVPPPSPIKPLYRLLLNIIYFSVLLIALCLLAGLFYAAMRLYRRRYGTLDADEAMTTLHLTGD